MKMEMGGVHLSRNEFSITIIMYKITQAAFLGQDLMPWFPMRIKLEPCINLGQVLQKLLHPLLIVNEKNQQLNLRRFTNANMFSNTQ